MNKYIIIVALLIVGSIAVIYTSGNKVTQDTMVEKASTDNQEISTDGTAPGEGTEPSQYVPYTSGVLDTVQQPRRVLFFYASWCPTCRPVDKSLQERIADLPSDVVVIRVNYNDPETDQEEKDLAKIYEVGYQHTFVQIDPQGNKIKLWNGGDIEELLQNLN